MDSYVWAGAIPFSKFAPWDAPSQGGAGIYCFGRAEPTGIRALYFGKAASFRSRLSHHERWYKAVGMGMDCVLLHYEGNEAERCAKERLLISDFPTAMNEQLNEAQDWAAALTSYAEPSPWQPGGALGAALEALGPTGIGGQYGLPQRPTAAEAYESAFDYLGALVPSYAQPSRRGLFGRRY